MHYCNKRIALSLSQDENANKNGVRSFSAGKSHQLNSRRSKVDNRLRLCLMLICFCATFSLLALESNAADLSEMPMVTTGPTILHPKHNSRVLNPNKILVEVEIPPVGSVLEWMIGVHILRKSGVEWTSAMEPFYIEQLWISSNGRFVGRKTIALEEGDYIIWVAIGQAGGGAQQEPYGTAWALFRVKRLDVPMALKPVFSILEPRDGAIVSKKDIDIVVGSPFAVDFILRLEKKRSGGNGTDVMWSKQCKQSDFALNDQWKRWEWTKTEEVGLGRYILSASPLLSPYAPPIEQGTVQIEFSRTMQGLEFAALPSLTILGSKRSYGPGESVVFLMKGDTTEAPVVECFDGRRWSSKCPHDLKLHKRGSGAQIRYTLQTSKAGKYRLRVGNVFSDEVEIKAAESTDLKPKQVPQEQKPHIAPKHLQSK
jgi:hypothetical protein